MQVKQMLIRLKNIYYLKIINLGNMKKLKKVIIGKNVLLEQKVYLTGKGNITIGDNVHFGYKMGGNWKGYSEIQARSEKARIIIKNGTEFNNNLFICSNQYIEIGENCLIGRDCEFLDFDGHGIAPDKRKTSGLQEPIRIGNNVWLGNGCRILRGSNIGNNCIVAAGSIVKGKFEDNYLIGGIPAKVLRKI
jgi:maltose O-acetyltransferase